MKPSDYSQPTAAKLPRAIARHRILSVALIAMMALLLGCASASYTNDNYSLSSSETNATVSAQGAMTGQWLIEFKTGED